MKAIYLFISMLAIAHVTGAIAGDTISDQAIPILVPGQSITVNVPPGGTSKLYKAWVPANVAHLKFSLITQTPNMYMWSNFGSPPVLETGTPRPDCEIPAITDETLGIQFDLIRCVFERPESGAYHFVRVFNEGLTEPQGINTLHVSYVANGLPSVADVSLKADYIDHYTGNAATSISHGVSGDIDDYRDRRFDFIYDESLGRYEERNGGLCDAGMSNNPTYVELELISSEPISACSFRGSWDLLWHDCSQALVDVINAQQTVVLNTDEHWTIFNNGQCSQDLSNIRMRGGLSYFHWFEIRPVVNGSLYYKNILIRKVNQAF